MAKRKRRPKEFSLVKAVKANARERLGQPKPGQVIEDQKPEKGRKAKHPETLAKLLSVE